MSDIWATYGWLMTNHMDAGEYDKNNKQREEEEEETKQNNNNLKHKAD